MAPDLSDAQLDAIAERVATDDDLAASIAHKLPTGRLGGRYLLNRRQLLALATGGATAVAGLTALGVDEAEAQAAAGQVGTPESPEDAYLAAVEAQSVSTDNASIDEIGLSGQAKISTQGPVTVDTSTTEIFTTSKTGGVKKGLLLVFSQGGGDDEFVDLLLFNSNESVDLISGSGADSAPSRSYGLPDQGVSLSLGSGSSNVISTAIEQQ